MLTLPLVFSALLLSGCGGQAGSVQDQEAAENIVSTPTATPTPTPTEETASAAQYGEIMLEGKKGVDDFLEEWESNGCSGPAVAAGDFTCGISVLSASLNADIVKLNFIAASKPTAPGFIGLPPAELEDLVDDTIAKADTAVTAAEEATEECPDGASCDLAVHSMERAMEDLQLKLEAWDLYLH